MVFVDVETYPGQYIAGRMCKFVDDFLCNFGSRELAHTFHPQFSPATCFVPTRAFLEPQDFLAGFREQPFLKVKPVLLFDHLITCSIVIVCRAGKPFIDSGTL